MLYPELIVRERNYEFQPRANYLNCYSLLVNYCCQYPRALNLIKTRSILLKLHTTTLGDFYLTSRRIQIGSLFVRACLGLIKILFNLTLKEFVAAQAEGVLLLARATSRQSATYIR